MIKNIIFDFGGVILTIDHPKAINRAKTLGLHNAEEILNPYTQGGAFGALEEGQITEEEFRKSFSELCHRELTLDDCAWAIRGYIKEVPQRNIEMLKRLRREGYRLILLSNTNSFMMDWAMSNDFSRGLDPDAPDGLPVKDYFDACYLSYKVKVMKPDVRFFQHVVSTENINPNESIFVDDGPRNVEAAASIGLHTFCPVNGSDWTQDLMALL